MSVNVVFDYFRHKCQSFLFLRTLVQTNVNAGGIKACLVCLPAPLSVHASCLDRHGGHTRYRGQMLHKDCP